MTHPSEYAKIMRQLRGKLGVLQVRQLHRRIQENLEATGKAQANPKGGKTQTYETSVFDHPVNMAVTEEGEGNGHFDVSTHVSDKKKAQSNKVFNVTGLTGALKGEKEGDLGINLDNSKYVTTTSERNAEKIDNYFENRETEKLRLAELEAQKKLIAETPENGDNDEGVVKAAEELSTVNGIETESKRGTSNVEITVIKQNVANIQAQLCKHGEKIRADLPIAQDRQAKRHTPDQQAVIALAKEAKTSGGLSLKEAKILRATAFNFSVEIARQAWHLG